MSPPDTDLQTQKRRHAGPLIGIAGVLIFALGLFVYWVGWEVGEGQAPEGADTRIDGRTGEPVEGSDRPASPSPTL